jgi:regulator of replication initiation timing
VGLLDADSDMSLQERIVTLYKVIGSYNYFIDCLQAENKALKMENEVLKDSKKGKQGKLRLLYPQIDQVVENSIQERE